MKIRKLSAKFVEFDSVKIGEVFRFCGAHYIKVVSVISNVNLKFNGVSLEDGNLHAFTRENVELVNCELVLLAQ